MVKQEMNADSTAAPAVRTPQTVEPERSKGRLAWITVSHPSLSSQGTIGDIIRLRTLRRALQAEGWTTRMITAADECQQPLLSQPRNETVRRRWIKDRVKQVVPRVFWSTLKDLSYRRLNHQFHDLLDRRPDRPDLIVDYNFYFNDAALRFARKHGIPIHLNFEGFIADSMADVPRSLLRRLGQRFELAKYAAVDAIWTVSKPLQAELRRLLGERAPDIHVIPNAMDPTSQTDRSLRAELRLEDKMVVGFIGGLSPWFSLPELLESCDRLRRDVPNLHLLLVGDGPQRRRLEGQLEKLGGGGWCTMVGQIPHEQAPRYIACFDVAVITNHKWWTSPLKLLEYGAAGVPVVAPRLPSITSMVDDGEVAFFTPDDFSDFQAKLKSILDLGRAGCEMGQILQRRVAADYGTMAMRRRIRLALGMDATRDS